MLEEPDPGDVFPGVFPLQVGNTPPAFPRLRVQNMS